MRRKFWDFDLNMRLHFIILLKWQMLSDKKKQKKKQTNWRTRLNLHVHNISKIIERGEKKVSLVFTIKFDLQITIYIRIVKFNGGYLFHIIIRSL